MNGWLKSSSGSVLGLGDDGYVTGDVHVYPENDLKGHAIGTEDGLTCWCLPVRDIEVPSVVIHSSMDERESYEQGRLPH